MLVDTSVWIDHFRRSNHDLEYLLAEGLVSTHPFVIGELACGSLAKRKQVLDLLAALPSVLIATGDEAHAMVERHSLFGTGLGWIDVHLLASAKLSQQPLWTTDRRLRAAAKTIGLPARE
jgi:predicted nucleic acid-binding protein